MPSWWVHRYFAHKLGLDVELSRIVDGIIDFAHILPDEYETSYGMFKFPKGVEKRHDWVRYYTIEAGKAFKEFFGTQAIKAMILHLVLDFIYENMDKYRKRFNVSRSLKEFRRCLRRIKLFCLLPMK